MNSALFIQEVEPVMNTVFDGVYAELPPEWTKIYEKETAIQRRFQDDSVLFGFGAAPEKGEGAPITYDMGGEAYQVRYLNKVYALAFALTEELIEDGDHINIASIYTKHLARSHRVTEEIVHAAPLNNATNGAFVGGDGVTLLNTAHPLAGGGTFSNTLTNPANLSSAALEQLLIQARTVPDERGNKIIAVKPLRLIIDPSNEFNADRILNSTLRPGTANNDINAIRNMGYLRDVVTLSQLTNPNIYFIQTDAPRGLLHLTRTPMKRAMEGDFDSGSMRYKARQRFAVGVTDPRAVFGSSGF